MNLRTKRDVACVCLIVTGWGCLLVGLWVTVPEVAWKSLFTVTIVCFLAAFTLREWPTIRVGLRAVRLRLSRKVRR